MNWNGTSVLVTGAGGFIGSHITERLVELGADVRALVHYNALGSWGWLDQSSLLDEIEVVGGDVTDADNMRKVMEGCEMVFHLAALIAIPFSYVAPGLYVRTNVIGTMNVLQAAREIGTSRLIHTSTSEVYGTARRVPIDEQHPLQGQSPYSATKIGADKLAESYHQSFGLPVVTVRPFNTFGPRQSTRAIIPTIITQGLAERPIRLGNLAPTRDLNYVADTVEGFICAAAAPGGEGKTFNVGSGREISIGELVELIAEIMGRNIEVESDSKRIRPEKSEVMRLLADSTKARHELGWNPTVGLEEGLRRTIAWIDGHLNAYRVGHYSL